jgi:hypothetical protein
LASRQETAFHAACTKQKQMWYDKAVNELTFEATRLIMRTYLIVHKNNSKQNVLTDPYQRGYPAKGRSVITPTLEPGL